MARLLHGRLVVSGTLRAERALHVGGGEEGTDTDLPLARDGRGDLYVPGTSLAGVLRGWWRGAFDEAVTRKIWGFQDRPDNGARPSQGHASRVQVEDGVVTLPAGARVALRDGVGIDREWGVAAPHIKYDRAVLPAGSRVALRLALELPDGEPGEDARAMTGHLLAALGRGELRLGAARTRGLGRVRLEEETAIILEQSLNRRAGVLAVLRAPQLLESGEPRTIAELIGAAPDLRPLPAPWVRIAIAWEPRGPLMVKAGADGLAIDSLPCVEPGPPGLALLLPGSSVKGALRSHAERIVRTVIDLPLGLASRPAPDPFLEQLEVPLVEWLFGARAKGKASGRHAGYGTGTSDGTPEPRPGRGALSVDDCFGIATVRPDRWDEVVQAEDSRAATEALRAAGLDHWTNTFHVAVDRWTGGAATGLLYTVLEPHGIAWEPIELAVDLARIQEDLRRPALSLLFLVLDDLVAGRVPLGFATNRGMGSVRVRRAHIEASDGFTLSLEGAHATIECEAGSFLRGLPPQVQEALAVEWGNWIATSERRR